VPVFHDSEVAAVGFMLQRILIKRGFLDSQGNQVPVAQLAARVASSSAAPMDAAAMTVSAAPGSLGAKCPECGARALHKAEGCTRCDNCQYVGECG
jgi:ribonucleoside-diphosphate reductase alpha chain